MLLRRGLKSVQSSFVYIFDICLRCSSINFNCWQGFYNRPHSVSIEKSLHDSFSRHFSRHCTPINISHKSENWACAHLMIMSEDQIVEYFYYLQFEITYIRVFSYVILYDLTSNKQFFKIYQLCTETVIWRMISSLKRQ